ncbi:hypothetical protein T4E_8373 [Trichinella pseudospiralis]|uniref:Uncharacterized protein n=1 Tax=Trichinella pseudospiralis TaxID=6337 RepID=A0A0V0YNT9_TRIPS|nr:hypothetical protein T4E_8373 [Trichinella pseudospiralis]
MFPSNNTSVQFTSKRSYPSQSDFVVLLRSFGHAAMPIFHVIVDSHTLTMHKFVQQSGILVARSKLPLEVPEQGFNLT